MIASSIATRRRLRTPARLRVAEAITALLAEPVRRHVVERLTADRCTLPRIGRGPRPNQLAAALPPERLAA
jgi:hypothetical protein